MTVACTACVDHVVRRLPYYSTRETREKGLRVRGCPVCPLTESYPAQGNHSTTDKDYRDNESVRAPGF